MKVIAMTQMGPHKRENEDRIVAGRSVISHGILEEALFEGMLAVADGVGGCNAGAVASQFVADRLCEADGISLTFMQDINSGLLEASQRDDTLRGMATTLSGVCISNGKVQLFSVGNTRVYLLQGGKYLKQLTVDDTTLQYLLATGRLTPQEAEAFDRKNEITACFGGGRAELFKLTIRELEPFTAPIVITSDGIHDHLTVDRMEEILEEHGLCAQACESMIAQARANGSRDDASILLAQP